MTKLLTISWLLTFQLVFGQSSIEIKEFELSREARGFQEHIRATRDSLYVSSSGRRSNQGNARFSRKITEKEWSDLVAQSQSLKLSELPELPSPSMKRASDAAMHATLTIITADGQSYSHGFDEGRPHEKLKALHDLLFALGNQKH